jgi:hypothetical protein
MVNKSAVITFSILALLGLVLIIIQAYNNTLPNEFNKTYSGKILFENKEQFAEFKRAVVANDAYEIIRCDELNSDYPVVVSFKIKMPHNDTFEYGDYTQLDKECYALYIIGGIFLAGFGSLAIAAGLSKKKW